MFRLLSQFHPHISLKIRVYLNIVLLYFLQFSNDPFPSSSSVVLRVLFCPTELHPEFQFTSMEYEGSHQVITCVIQLRRPGQSFLTTALVESNKKTSKCHLDTAFLGFPLSIRKCWEGSQTPSCYGVLLMKHSRLNSVKINLNYCQSH
jgi:hypothetical protein